MTGLQDPRVVSNIDAMSPADRSIDLPQIDPSHVSLVAPIFPGWIGARPLALHEGSISINGAAIDRYDDALAVVWRAGEDVEVTNNRYYYNVHVSLNGGTVTPIMVLLYLETLAAAPYVIASRNCVNLGAVGFGPVFVPAGLRLKVHVSAGGAGDQAFIHLDGFQAAPGVPMPLVPGLNSYAR